MVDSPEPMTRADMAAEFQGHAFPESAVRRALRVLVERGLVRVVGEKPLRYVADTTIVKSYDTPSSIVKNYDYPSHEEESIVKIYETPQESIVKIYEPTEQSPVRENDTFVTFYEQPQQQSIVKIYETPQPEPGIVKIYETQENAPGAANGEVVKNYEQPAKDEEMVRNDNCLITELNSLKQEDNFLEGCGEPFLLPSPEPKPKAFDLADYVAAYNRFKASTMPACQTKDASGFRKKKLQALLKHYSHETLIQMIEQGTTYMAADSFLSGRENGKAFGFDTLLRHLEDYSERGAALIKRRGGIPANSGKADDMLAPYRTKISSYAD